MKCTALSTVLVAAAVLAGSTLALAADDAPKSIEQAQKIAEARGVPVLVSVEVEWSASCRKFREKFDGDSEFNAVASEGVVLVAVDGETDDGMDLVRAYGVYGYPTFLLTDPSGELMDTWQGFEGTKKFIHMKRVALSDPVTIVHRMERFRDNPTEADAAKLASLRMSFGYPAEAVAYYRRAQTLNPASDKNYEIEVLRAMASGAHSQLYTTLQVRTQADVVFASATAKEMYNAYGTVRKVARSAHEPEIAYPYLRVTYEAMQESREKGLLKAAEALVPEYALHIERDEAKALSARKALLPADWEKSGRRLNEIAWWCFENQVNLTEAEEWARRGVELSKPGRARANVLDTLAEICNKNNDCVLAVQYIREAITEDPKNEYFRNQLDRFEEVLAAGN